MPSFNEKLYHYLISRWFVLSIAFSAINRSVTRWYKRYFCFLFAICTCCFVHFSRSAAVASAASATAETASSAIIHLIHLISRWFVLSVAFSAINRSVARWYKRYLCFFFAICTCCFVHFSRPAAETSTAATAETASSVIIHLYFFPLIYKPINLKKNSYRCFDPSNVAK
jgi:hypothetical protein